MDTVLPISILWDASHIWGLMVWRAVRALGMSCRLVSSSDITEGVLLGKRDGNCLKSSLLLAPGGNARHKARALGQAGREAVRDYVSRGGRYLGFCGGAGLALSHADSTEGLNICPWGRASRVYPLQHLISGHVRAHIYADANFSSPVTRPLPVWWPGRFEAQGAGVAVLAACDSPDKDFWIADLPLQRVPAHVFSAWQKAYGVDLSADFLAGEPLVISGDFGKGRYVLSYSHLETPQSPDANRWFACLLGELTGCPPKTDRVPAWDLRQRAVPCARTNALLGKALQKSYDLLRLAVEQYLFFERAPWLWGWRAGLPGAACNHLHAALYTALAIRPTDAALDCWDRKSFFELSSLFFTGAQEYLWACRLSGALASTLPNAVDDHNLAEKRDALFGHPMHGGGVVEQLLVILEKYLYLAQDANEEYLL